MQDECIVTLWMTLTHLQDAWPDGNGGDTLTHGFDKRVDGARVTVLLDDMAARTQERTELSR